MTQTYPVSLQVVGCTLQENSAEERYVSAEQGLLPQFSSRSHPLAVLSPPAAALADPTPLLRVAAFLQHLRTAQLLAAAVET